MKKIVLNMTREAAAEFVNWLSNDGYWGHTETQFDIEHGAERVVFLINGHELSNFSNQKNQLVIDGCYTQAGGRCACTGADGVTRDPLSHCLYKLGF